MTPTMAGGPVAGQASQPAGEPAGGPAPESVDATGSPRRRWRRVMIPSVVLTAVLLLAVLGVAVRLSPPPRVAVRAAAAAPVVAPGSAPSLPWPAAGEAAVSVPAVGFAARSGPERPVPVASLTKLMTAWVILRDHPLSHGEPGPTVTMTATDVADYVFRNASDQAGVQVVAGETLTERQLLEGLIVRSAGNLADTLARWDAGTIAAFVAKMNAAARGFGMSHTRFVDATGFDPGSMSTAGDLLELAAALMAEPSFATIADMPSITLPVAGFLYSYTPLVGTQGVVGVKSGLTQAAGGCDVLALATAVDGRPLLVLAAVTGQDGPDVLAQAGSIALGLARAAASGVRPVRVLRRGELVGFASSAGDRVRVVATAPASVLAWAGRSVVARLRVTDRPVGGAAAGTVIAQSVVTSGRQRIAVPARLAGNLPTPSLAKRLF